MFTRSDINVYFKLGTFHEYVHIRHLLRTVLCILPLFTASCVFTDHRLNVIVVEVLHQSWHHANVVFCYE